MSDACRSCRAPVVWALTPKGERSPVDAGVDGEKGNVLLLNPRGLDQAIAVVLSGGALELARATSVPLHLSHWATCPDRQDWRERTDAAVAEFAQQVATVYERVACPKCDAPIGEVCRAMPLGFIAGGWAKGKELKHPHNERLRADGIAVR